MTITDKKAIAEAYAAGYANGEDSVGADWELALSDIIPEPESIGPFSVAAYIRRLQAQLIERGGNV